MTPKDDGDWTETTITSESDVKPAKKATAGARYPYLDQRKGPGSPRKLYLTSNITVFGRSSNCTVQLYSSEVSRTHLMIKQEGGRFICQDLNSYNGTHLNGVRIHSAELRSGDTIQIGNVVFIFRLGG